MAEAAKAEGKFLSLRMAGQHVANMNIIKAKYRNWIDKYDGNLHLLRNETRIKESTLMAQMFRAGFEDELRKKWEAESQELLLQIGEHLEKVLSDVGNKKLKRSISIPEVGKIFKYQATKGTWEEKARDYWSFSYMCNGINVKDMALLPIWPSAFRFRSR